MDITDTNLINLAIEDLRRRLVDLSGNNRMLNFRHYKRSTLSVVNTNPHSLLEAMLNGRQARFRSVPEPEENIQLYLAERAQKGAEGASGRPAKPEAREHAQQLGIDVRYELPRGAGQLQARGEIPLQTLFYEDRLDSVLTHIRRTAISVEQESGSNMLYMVFGFLEWFPAESVEKPYLAPLVLLPVRLEKKKKGNSGRHVFSLQYDEVDLEANVSLYEKFGHDFGLNLPEMSDEPELNPYFQKVEQLV